MRNRIRNLSKASTLGWLAVAAAFVALAVPLPANAQITRGTISGLVVDSTGAVVPGAKVTLIETETNVRTTAQTEPDGLFLIAGVLPGSYTLRVEAGGFKTLERTNLNLSAGERLDIGQIQLQVGSEAQTLTVTTAGDAVQLDTSSRGDVVTTKDMEYLPMAGRNWASLLNVLPGAITQPDSLEPDSGNANIPIYNGVSNAFSAIYEDGISNNLQRSYQYGAGETPDVIAEVKVETGNFNAEYGGAGGANVQLISKSGTSEIHGNLFAYVRNEKMDANDFFNVLTGSPKPVDRFQDYGGTIGGPIFWPGKFNQDKNKLFFFIGQEYVPVNGPAGGLSTLTMPTAAQRSGDFSQTPGVTILDPLNNHQPFPGNMIPASRINSAGQGLLNVFPLPNFDNPAVSSGQYNYIYQPYLASYNNYHFYRVDWDPTQKLRMFWRLDYDPVGDTQLFGTNWPELTTTDTFPYTVTAVDVSYTFSPTMINDFVFGMNGRRESNIPKASQFAALNRLTNGANIPQFNPQNNPNNLIPDAAFGGGVIPNAPAMSLNGVIPYRAWVPTFTGSDSLTVVRGTHTIKGGVYFTWNRYFTDGGGYPYRGSFDFSSNANNPFDTSHPYANALLGTYTSYQESKTRPVQDIRGLVAEWYLQDTWKVTRRLTLNYGMRFSYYTPWHQANGLGLNFLPSAYDPSQAVQLYHPFINAQGQLVAQNPVTGQTLPQGFIGSIVPGVGNINNGLVSAKASGVPEGFMNNRGVQYGPRFGFAYALTNDDKTVVRGGFGMAYSGHDNQNLIVGTVLNTSQTASEFNGTFGTLTSAPTAIFPNSYNAINPNTKYPTIMSYSLGVQRSIGLGTRVDVAYVGSLTRHLDDPQSAFDNVPPGAEFLPQNQDPTNPGLPLPDDFFRPYRGYSGLTVQQFVNSNYNALQVSAVHRFSKNFDISANYAWSKSLGYYPPFATYHDNKLQYGVLPFDRTNVLRFYYVYNLPKASTKWNVNAVRWVLDDWQLSGISQFQSGFPQSLNCQFTYPVNLFGGGDYSRCNLTGPVHLSMGNRTFYRFFDTSVIQPPTRTNPGNAAPGVVRGPGVEDFAITLFKNFPFGEKRYVQFRLETFNTFNHPQFNTVNTNPQFDQTGAQVNGQLGQIISDYLPRQVQLVLKLYF
ncbi:MAG TPA: carboxypeptidase-like regulatory domain-containing protein [Bryobacteraceae bacterium]|nr:carboxypeptidase-like regulatory domain-containing protein [Bryobacteraceae bacterium]